MLPHHTPSFINALLHFSFIVFVKQWLLRLLGSTLLRGRMTLQIYSANIGDINRFGNFYVHFFSGMAPQPMTIILSQSPLQAKWGVTENREFI